MHPTRYALLSKLANNSVDITKLGDDDRHALAWLCSRNYVSVPMHGINRYSVTESGYNALADEAARLDSLIVTERNARRKARAEWIRYSITTLIALAALLKSFWPEITAAAARLSILLAHR